MKKIVTIFVAFLLSLCTICSAAEIQVADGVANFTWNISSLDNLWGYRIKIYLENGILTKDTTDKFFDYDFHHYHTIEI